MCSNFYISDEQLQHIEKRMIMEINWGLGKDTNPSSNIKSYITYVSQLPTGREAGEFLALDLGGTNFRVILISLDAKSTSVRMTAMKHAVSEELMTGPGVNLFNFMADKLREFMVDHNLLGRTHYLGFTFSFPTVQHSLASADLASWTTTCWAGLTILVSLSPFQLFSTVLPLQIWPLGPQPAGQDSLSWFHFLLSNCSAQSCLCRSGLLDHNLLGRTHYLGFTFSFPTVQHSLASADL